MMIKWLSNLAIVSIRLASTMTHAASEESQLANGKQTPHGLYMTAAPGEVTLVDVRSAEESAFVGHPEASLTEKE